MNQRISIAMCTYNGACYLPEQLGSFMSQTRLPDELVVCDDGSSDATLEILQAFAGDVPFEVRIFINESNLGSTRNFEKVIGLCEGDIVFLSDQDDVWLPDKLSRVERDFLRFPETAGVLTDAIIVDESLRPLGFNFWQATGFDSGQQKKAIAGRPATLIRHNSSMAGATFAMRREMREFALPVPEGWTHDAWIVLIIAVMAKLAIVPEPLNLWRQHEDQQLGSWTKKSLTEQKELAFGKDMADDAAMAARRYRSARERIGGMAVSDTRQAERLSELLMRLKEKSSHLNARARMGESRLRCLPAIAAELMSGRYFRYSSGLKSAARDLVIKS